MYTRTLWCFDVMIFFNTATRVKNVDLENYCRTQKFRYTDHILDTILLVCLKSYNLC